MFFSIFEKCKKMQTLNQMITKIGLWKLLVSKSTNYKNLQNNNLHEILTAEEKFNKSHQNGDESKPIPPKVVSFQFKLKSYILFIYNWNLCNRIVDAP